jgi:hypothetical protein
MAITKKTREEIVNAITQCALSLGYDLYLWREDVFAKYIPDYKPTKTSFVLTYNGDFNVDYFYQKLIESITIQKQVENNPQLYSFLSDNHYVEIRLVHVQAEDVLWISSIGNFTVEQLAFDLRRGIAIAPGNGLADVKANPPVIRSTKPTGTWTAQDVFGCFELESDLNGVISDQDKIILAGLNLQKFVTASLDECIEGTSRIFGSARAGNGIRSLIAAIPNSQQTFLQLLVRMCSLYNIPMREGLAPDEVFSSVKLETINVLPRVRGRSNVKNILKLLFESAYVENEQPLIQRVKVLGQDVSLESSPVQTLDGYAPCNPEDPNNCPVQCCCCSGEAYADDLSIRAFTQQLISCHRDGTGLYRPEEGAYFSSGCVRCQEICEDVYSGILGGWGLPFGSCSRTCASGTTDNCDLWCVECNQPCKANVRLVRDNCALTLELTPSYDCAGNPPKVDVMFVLDYGGVGMQTILTNYAAQLLDFINGIRETGAYVRAGIVTFGHGTSEITYTVSATSCINFAGQSDISDLVHGDRVGTYRPVEVAIPLGATQVTIRATGLASHCAIDALCPQSGPDGQGGFPVVTYNDYACYNISTLATYYVALTGVFLTDNPPSAPTPPMGGSVNPPLQQSFVCGEGPTTINIPSGATRLFLGVHDDYDWRDNRGGFSATVSFDTSGIGGTPTLYQNLTAPEDIVSSFGSTSGGRVYGGDVRPVNEALLYAANNAIWSDSHRVIMCITNNPDQTCDAADECDLQNVVIPDLQSAGVEVYFLDVSNPNHSEIVAATGGNRWDVASTNLSDLGDNVGAYRFSSSFDCLAEMYTVGPIRLPFCRELSQCTCELPPVYVPWDGSMIVLEYENERLVCCNEIGCDCQTVEPCCGVSCTPICNSDPEWPYNFSSKRQAIDALWCECWDSRIGPATCGDCCCPDGVDQQGQPILGDPNHPCQPGESAFGPDGQRVCCNCPDEDFDLCCFNCQISFEGGTTKTRSDIIEEVEQEWTKCEKTSVPPEWKEPDQDCTQTDECIAGEPDVEPCSPEGCTSTRKPSTVVLNNGIGLVAYESAEDISVIKIKQFTSSVRQKIFNNREFWFGQLQNQSLWQGNIARLYIYDEEVATRILSDAHVDSVVFRSGPLQFQYFPLLAGREFVADSDPETAVVGYLQINVGAATLTNDFPSTDDVYDVQWFLLDGADTQRLIGSWVDSTPDGQTYDVDINEVNTVLELSPHTYNGERVPVTNPSIDAAKNYQNSTENSQFVYVTYQAYEDNKWNVYLRQLRLSEYRRSNPNDLPSSQIVGIDDAGITELIYRVVCKEDECVQTEDGYLTSRKITMEVVSKDDGREILNSDEDIDGNWVNLCRGQPDSGFPKRQVFVSFWHRAKTDRCPTVAEAEDLFFDWEVGTEFNIPATDLSALGLFSLLRQEGETTVETGTFSPPKVFGTVSVSSATVEVVYYKPYTHQWYVITDARYADDLAYKGIQIDEPILLSGHLAGHATNPVVKVNYYNDVFVAYECSDSGVQQIHLIGTAIPASSLPTGYATGRALESGLHTFYRPYDFVYHETLTSDGINQLPSMYIDKNDVVHLSWQSNRDNRWEIYYANSLLTSATRFENTRITNYPSRSMRPSIAGACLQGSYTVPMDYDDNVYVTWHDDRFGHWEVMLAYLLRDHVKPLAQQDAYLASLRTGSLEHYRNDAQLILENPLDDAICLEKVTLFFYKNRLGEGTPDFIVDSKNYAYAFSLGTDYSEQTFDATDISGWSTSGDPTAEFIYESPEIDTGLLSSKIQEIFINYVLGVGTDIQVAFRASDEENDPLAALQWTTWSTTPADAVAIDYTGLSLSPVYGRYKQVRIKTSNSISVQVEVSEFRIKSVNRSTVCMAGHDTYNLPFSLTPEIRIDRYGGQTATVSLPLAIETNQAYFIKAVGLTTENRQVVFGMLPLTISCDYCSKKDLLSWEELACSVAVQIPHNFDGFVYSGVRYFNVRVKIYNDVEKENLIGEFLAFPDGDLGLFTVDNNTSAASVWTSLGYPVSPGGTLNLYLWPSLSDTEGLQCGIPYQIDIDVCAATEDTEIPCPVALLKNYQSKQWVCQCESARWDSIFEDAPVNIRTQNRWISSAFGKSDTRITETNYYNSLNPIIQIRESGQGVIIYQSERKHDSSGKWLAGDYQLFACVFKVSPKPGMYASAAQSIDSLPSVSMYKSDIPLKVNNNEAANETINGRGHHFSLDQYDNIFLAYEVVPDQTKCEEFQLNKQTIIKVHRCGAHPKFEEDGEQESNQQQETYCHSEIFDKAHVESNLLSETKTVKVFRVHPISASHYVTKNGDSVAVVKDCSIRLEIVGTPEVYAYRLKNVGEDWTSWLEFEPRVGDYSIIVAWTLTKGSGEKHVALQLASYTGLVEEQSILIYGDFNRIQYEVRLFRPKESTQVSGGVDAFFTEANIAPYFDGVPVVGLYGQGSNYLFVEIIPSLEYCESQGSDLVQNTPTFDLIQQGTNDQYSIATTYTAEGTRGRPCFRGYVEIKKEDQYANLDGLAFILVHFKNDCSDPYESGPEEQHFNIDRYNLIISGTQVKVVAAEDDPFLSQRHVDGQIGPRQSIRNLNEQPYLIYGIEPEDEGT